MPDQRTFRSITADELAAVWPRTTLVDVRIREEHSTAHVPGSLNVPLDELASRLSDLPNTTIHLMCGSGKRSSQAARFLTNRGYTAVNVAGGITEWYRAGHPVTYQQTPADHPDRTPGPCRRASAGSFNDRPTGKQRPPSIC